MADYYQVVHARVHPEVEEEMLGHREAFVISMRRAVPGLLDAQLVKLEDGTWLDIVRWASPADAEAGASAHERVPEAAEMGRFVSEVTSIQQGRAAHSPILAR
jgi:hypothetical protein